jgi:hypothetical protein
MTPSAHRLPSTTNGFGVDFGEALYASRTKKGKQNFLCSDFRTKRLPLVTGWLFVVLFDT